MAGLEGRQQSLGRAFAGWRGNRRALGELFWNVTKAGSIATAAGVVAGCGNEAPRYDDYIQSGDRLSPIARAGNVLISRSTDPSAEPDGSSFGHGGLFEHNGRHYLVTVQHVADIVADNQFLTARFLGANGNTYRVDLRPHENVIGLSTSVPIPGSPDGQDQVIAYDLSGAPNYGELMQAITNEEVVPLHIDNSQEALYSRLGVVNSDGQIVEVKYEQPIIYPDGSTSPVYRIADVVGGEVCRGQSGSAVFVLDAQGGLTNQSVGLLSNAGSQAQCTDGTMAFMSFNAPQGIAIN